jgi:hypothetical protein
MNKISATERILANDLAFPRMQLIFTKYISISGVKKKVKLIPVRGRGGP